MNKDTIDNIIAIAKLMPTDGHSLKYSDVADIMTAPQWGVCREWFSLNAKPYVITSTTDLTAVNERNKDIILEKLRLMRIDIEQAEKDRQLNNQVLEDTLHNNKITRRIAVWSLIVAIAAFAVSIVIPCCSQSEDSSGEQQRLKNDSILRVSSSLSSEPGLAVNAPSREKSLTLISDNSRSKRLICATLISSKRIVTVLSSTLPRSLKL